LFSELHINHYAYSTQKSGAAGVVQLLTCGSTYIRCKISARSEEVTTREFDSSSRTSVLCTSPETPVHDNYNLKWRKYVWITIYQPDTKSNPDS